jgi:nucleoside-diphosphate-sugar epimerase
MTKWTEGKARVLVTGAAGRLGSFVARYLTESGVAVVATDRESGSLNPTAIHVVDLADPGPVVDLVRDVSAVVHCAAWPGRGVIPPREVLASNVEATLNLCQAALAAGVEKFVYASSVQVFGSRVMLGAEGPEVEYLPLDGVLSPNPRNLYGFSKAVGEVLVRSILSTAGVECQSVRFPWLVSPEPGKPWGRRLQPLSVEENWVEIEQGFTCLSFNDAARLVLACLNTTLPGYRTYYPGVSVVPSELLDTYLDRYYSGVPLRKPRRELASLVDLAAIEADTGWTPEYIPDRMVFLPDVSSPRRALVSLPRRALVSLLRRALRRLQR